MRSGLELDPEEKEDEKQLADCRFPPDRLFDHGETPINFGMQVYKIFFIITLRNLNNLYDIMTFVNSFRLLSRGHNAIIKSQDGKLYFKKALIAKNITSVEIDKYIVKCFEAKNLLMLQILLELLGSDIELHVYKNPNTHLDKSKISSIRLETFAKSDIVVNEQQHMSPLLHYAISRSWPEAVKLLIDLGADIFSKAYYTHYVEATYGRSIVSNNYEFFPSGMQPIHVAAKLQNGNLYKFCLRKNGRTPDSTIENNAFIFNLLINKKNIDIVDDQGRAPLHIAAENHNDNAVRVLISQGANVNCLTASGFTPLLLSIARHNSEAIQMLIENGATMPTPQYLYNALACTELYAVKEYIKRNPEIVNDSSSINQMADSIPVCNRNESYLSDYLASLAPKPGEFIDEVLKLIPDDGNKILLLQSMILKSINAKEYDLVSDLLRLGEVLNLSLHFDRFDYDLKMSALLTIANKKLFIDIMPNGVWLYELCERLLKEKDDSIERKKDIIEEFNAYHRELTTYLKKEISRLPDGEVRKAKYIETLKKADIKKGIFDSIKHIPGYNKDNSAEIYIKKAIEKLDELKLLYNEVQDAAAKHRDDGIVGVVKFTFWRTPDSLKILNKTFNEDGSIKPCLNKSIKNSNFQ